MAKRFNNLSTRAQLLAFGALCLALVAGVRQAVLAPARAGVSSRESRLGILRRDVGRARLTASTLPALVREVRAMEAALDQRTATPGGDHATDVLRTLHDLASASSLDISSFVPRAMATQTRHVEWAIQVGLEGGYHDLGRFLDRVAAMPPLMLVSDLHIKASGKSDARKAITATCVATLFVFKRDAAARASPVVAAAMTGGAK